MWVPCWSEWNRLGNLRNWDKQQWRRNWERVVFWYGPSRPNEARAFWIHGVSSVEHTIADTIFFCLWISIDPSTWRLSYHLVLHNMFNSLSWSTEMLWFLSRRFISCVEITSIFPASIKQQPWLHKTEDNKNPSNLAGSPFFPRSWMVTSGIMLSVAWRAWTCNVLGNWSCRVLRSKAGKFGGKIGVCYREGGL